MKKIMSAMLVCSILATMMLTGCSKEETKDTVKKGNDSSDVQQDESSNTDDSKTDDSKDDDSSENDESKTDDSSKEDDKKPNVSVDTDISLDSFEDIVQADIAQTTKEMQSEYETLSQEINTYEKYLDNTDKVEAFYANLTETHYQLCIRMYEYTAAYAILIMESDSDNDDKYDDLEEIYDIVYDDAGDDIYDAFYEDILDEMYDLYYDGILDDADNDDISYEEWFDALSNEYDLWLDAHSDIYEDWLDTHSDIYDFYTDIRSEVYSDDIERANSKLDKFKEKIEEMKD